MIHAFPREKVPQAVAIWGAAGAVAGALGPTLGAAIVESLGWRWAFYLNLPVGVFTIATGRRMLRESADPSVRVPAGLGVVLVAVAAAVLAFAVVESDSVGWLSAQTISVVAVGLTLSAVFVLHQRRTDAPVLDLELFRIGNFSWGNLAGFAFGIAFSAMFFGSILFLTNIWSWSILKAGFGVAPGPASVAVLAPSAGKLAGRIGQRPLLLCGGAVYAVGGVYRLLVLGADVSYWIDYFPSMILAGIGVALCLPQLSSVVAQSLPANRIGVGGGALQAVRQLGGTFGVALTIAFLGVPSSLAAALSGFDRIWWIIVAGGLATSAFSVPLSARPAVTVQKAEQ